MAGIFGNLFGDPALGNKGAGLLPYDSPISQFVSPRRNALMGLSAGLLSGNPGSAMNGVMQGAQLDRQWAEDLQQEQQASEQTNMTKEWLRQRGRDDLIPLVDAGQGMFALQQATQPAEAPGSDLMSVGGNLYDPATGQWISPPADVAANRQNVSLTPQWGQDAQGNWVMLQPSSTGQLVQSEVPEGVTLVDPRQINMERAQGTAIGQAAGQAQVAAPGDIASGEMALDLLNQIRTNPELPYATGTMAGLGANKVPGTGRYGFQNLVDQAKNGAFLSAIQQMRGMGALSNAEGQAATSAITRMDTALSQQDFLKALDDYEQIVIRGVERARQRGGMAPGSPQQPAGGNIDSILQKYGVQ